MLCSAIGLVYHASPPRSWRRLERTIDDFADDRFTSTLMEKTQLAIPGVTQPRLTSIYVEKAR